LTRRRAAAVALAAAAVVLLLLVGRWERSQHADEEVRGMRSVLREIGSLGGPALARFRYLPRFQCLLYARGGDVVALELCVDADGRVVEAIDRRDAPPKIWSLRDDPTRSSLRVDRGLVDRLLLRLGLPPRYVELAHGREAE
jgi:hypothetical protein